jgi:hypothetical protein
MAMENVQYLTDNQGERTSVVIPISEWNRLSKYLEQLNSLDEIANSVKQGLKEAKSMESSGIRNDESINEFLDGL